MSINDRELDQRLGALPQAAHVDDAIWTKIEHRLHARNNRRWIGGGAIAASLVAVIVLTNINAPDWSELHRNQAIQAEVRAMNATTLLPQLVDQIGWSDEMMAAWNQYQTAIDELEAALELNPGYQMLVDSLAEARLQQSRLLNQAKSTRFMNTQQAQDAPTGVSNYEI